MKESSVKKSMQQSASFTAADQFPIKLLQSPDAVKSENMQRHILPYHVQLCPTNKCNLNCSWCSCKKRNAREELSIEQLMNLLVWFKANGTRALTVTGGGEPLMHKKISTFLAMAAAVQLQTGLVTNGFLFSALSDLFMFRTLTWCRISCGDDRDISKWIEAIDPTVKACSSVDWAVSYVVSRKPDIEKIEKVIQFVNQREMTHIRLVSDLLDIKHATPMDHIRRALAFRKVDLSRVIFQERTQPEHGFHSCRVSKLRPVFAADGYVYPCCGAQYAIKDDQQDFPVSMRMCSINDLLTDKVTWKDLPVFNGSVCDTCYYGMYNRILNRMMQPVQHREFV